MYHKRDIERACHAISQAKCGIDTTTHKWAKIYIKHAQLHRNKGMRGSDIVDLL